DLGRVDIAPAGGDVLVGPNQITGARTHVVATRQDRVLVNYIFHARLDVSLKLRRNNEDTAYRQRLETRIGELLQTRGVRQPLATEDCHHEFIPQFAQPPDCVPAAAYRAIRCHGPHRQARREVVFVRGVEAGVSVEGWQGQPAAVDQAAGKIVAFGQAQHSIPEEQTHFALGCDEVRGPRGIENVLVCRQFAFFAIAVQQGGRGLATQYQVQLPPQLVNILYAAVCTARAKR